MESSFFVILKSLKLFLYNFMCGDSLRGLYPEYIKSVAKAA